MTERERQLARWRAEFRHLAGLTPEEYLARWNVGEYSDGWEENTWGMWARALLDPTDPGLARVLGELPGGEMVDPLELEAILTPEQLARHSELLGEYGTQDPVAPWLRGVAGA